MTENYRSERHLVDFSNDFLRNVSRRMKVTPIKSMKDSDGRVEVVHSNSLYMYKPLVDCLMSHKGKGSSCILTQTKRKKTVTLVAILRRHGIKCKLIQSIGRHALLEHGRGEILHEIHKQACYFTADSG